MRGSIGRRLPNHSALGNATGQALIPSSSAFFSTSSAGGGGSGRGRGRGSSFGHPKLDFAAGVPGKTDSDDSKSKPDDSPFPSGLGHGRGKPLPSTPILPSFSSWMSAVAPSSSAGRGRVTGRATTQPSGSAPPEPQSQGPKKPIFFRKEDADEPTRKTQHGDSLGDEEESSIPTSILSAMSTGGAGRGKPLKQSGASESIQEENRHLRPRESGRPSPGRGRDGARAQDMGASSLSREEAVKMAMGILSRGEEGGGGRGFRGRGGRGGRGSGREGVRGRGRGRGRWGGAKGRDNDLEDDAAGLYLGDKADGEKFATKVGPEIMNEVVEGFEEMSGRVLPSPIEEAYLDAMHTNYMIECEPEYLVEFGNPDIDEKPPIPLRDALEKVKPFLMAYEGIQSQEEWEEVIEETMKKVPCMKELVDYYSGPDRVTAKQQQEELERVAKTIPESVPASVKKYADRAVLSLQSNPGWGFDKKCQFMDKLVWEVSQHYK